MNTLYRVTLILIFSFFSTLVYGVTQSEEIGYDQLVTELSRHARTLNSQNQEKAADRFSDLRVYGHFGFVDQISTLEIGDRSLTRFSEGIVMGVGVDLIPNEWVAEGVFKNYGKRFESNIELSLRSFDIRFNYHRQAHKKLDVKVLSGLGLNNLKIRDDSLNISDSQSIPNLILGFGLESHLNDVFGVGVELLGHTALNSRPIQKNGLDFALTLRSTF